MALVLAALAVCNYFDFATDLTKFVITLFSPIYTPLLYVTFYSVLIVGAFSMLLALVGLSKVVSWIITK